MTTAPYSTVSAITFCDSIDKFIDSKKTRFALRRIAVAGPVDLTVRSFPAGLFLRDIVFKDRVRLRNCTFDASFSLIDCTFLGGLDLSGSCFASKVTCVDTSFGPTHISNDDPQLVFSFASFRSDVDFVGVTVFGTLDGRHSEISGSLRFAGLQLSALGSTSAPLDLSYATVHGDLSFAPDWSARWTYDGTDFLFSKPTSDTAREMSLSKAFCQVNGLNINEYTNITIKYNSNADNKRDVVFFGILVNGRFTMDYLTCGGPIDCTSATINFLGARVTTIYGNLTLSSTKSNFIKVEGLKLTGSLIMIGGRSGQIDFDDFVSGQYLKHTTLGALIIANWECTDWARFGVRSVTLQKNADSTFDVRGVLIKNSSFRSDLEIMTGRNALNSFTGRDLLEATKTNPWFGGLETNGPIQITDNQIGGKLEITNVKTDGIIDLSGTKCKKIVCSSPGSALYGDVYKTSIRLVYLTIISLFIRREDLDEELESSIFARARQLSLKEVSAESIDITGLVLQSNGNSSNDGYVNAIGAKVSQDFLAACRTHLQDLNSVSDWKRYFGDLINIIKRPRFDLNSTNVYTELIRTAFMEAVEYKQTDIISYIDNVMKNNTYLTAAASIPRSLKLDKAEIGRLHLSRDCFPDDPIVAGHHNKRPPPRVSLDGAKIGELCVYRSKPASGKRCDEFPYPISMRSISVVAWHLGAPAKKAKEEADERKEPDESEPYLDLLDNEPDFNALSYLNVEKALRNRGHDRAALEIHWARHFRAGRAHYPSESHFRWRPGFGRRQHRWPFFRMQRPLGETLESGALLAALIVLMVVTIQAYEWFLGDAQSSSGLLAADGRVRKDIIAFIMSLLIMGGGVAVMGQRGDGGLRPIARPFLRLSDRLYWTFLDYGTSAWRLVIVILSLMGLSLLLVANQQENFEPTAQATVAMRQAAAGQTPDMQTAGKQAPGRPTQFKTACQNGDRWTAGDAIWMTLRYHIPLVNIGVADDCQPADGPLHLQWIAKDGAAPGWWTKLIGGWPKAQDWFGLMAILNYILWPLFIPFFVKQIMRQ